MLDELPDAVDHFRYRVLQDAISEATCAYWSRRADALAQALPRPGDFPGRNPRETPEQQRERVLGVIAACRARAQVSLGGDLALSTASPDGAHRSGVAA